LRKLVGTKSFVADGHLRAKCEAATRDEEQKAEQASGLSFWEDEDERILDCWFHELWKMQNQTSHSSILSQSLLPHLSS